MNKDKVSIRGCFVFENKWKLLFSFATEPKQPKQKKEVLEEEDLAYIKESKDFVSRVR